MLTVQQNFRKLGTVQFILYLKFIPLIAYMRTVQQNLKTQNCSFFNIFTVPSVEFYIYLIFIFYICHQSLIELSRILEKKLKKKNVEKNDCSFCCDEVFRAPYLHLHLLNIYIKYISNIFHLSLICELFGRILEKNSFSKNK